MNNLPSLGELNGMENPSVEIILGIVVSYVEQKHAINGEIVVNAIERSKSNWSEENLLLLLRVTKKATVDHLVRYVERKTDDADDAENYAKIVSYIRKLRKKED